MELKTPLGFSDITPKSNPSVLPIVLVLALLVGMALSPLAFLKDEAEVPSVASKILP